MKENDLKVLLWYPPPPKKKRQYAHFSDFGMILKSAF